MYQSVKEVFPSDDYTLTIVFQNNESGILDIKPMLDFGVFKQLKELEVFRQVRVSFDTIEWDCGVDLDPEFVYEKCKTGTPA